MSILSTEMLGLMAPAFAAGIMVCAVHVPLGQEVLRRGIIFIDLAIAQIAALGVVCAGVAFDAEDGFFPYGMALFFAMTGSLLFAWIGKKTPQYQEAFIGCAFVVAASLILVLLAGHPHGGEEVEGLLAGQILWVGWDSIFRVAGVYIVSLAAWFFYPQRRGILFYFLFPLVVTVSVQMVGVYLVFASLIMPALAATAFDRRWQTGAGYAVAFISVLAGLIISVLADLPAGPALVCTLAAISLGVGLFRAGTAPR